MISGAFCPTHGSSNLHFIKVTAPNNDVVNEVPVFGPGMHPRSLVHVTVLEESVCDGKIQFRAERKQPETLKSPSNMNLSSCVILRRVECNVS